MERFDLKSATYEGLTEYITSLGEKPFRAKQIYEWMHVKHVTAIDEMTNLSKNLREQLNREVHLYGVGADRCADIQTGRHAKIPVRTGGRQCDRECADAL